MVSLLVGQIIKYRLGVPVVAMESRIRVQSRNPVKYVNLSANSDDLSMLLQCGNRSKSHGSFEPSVSVANATSI